MRRAGVSAEGFWGLVSPASAAALDGEASSSWGLSPQALVEAAGRACGARLGDIPGLPGGRVLVCAGPGNNGADALVALRFLLMAGRGAENPRGPRGAAALLSKFPPDDGSPRSGAVRALTAMGIPVLTWKGEVEAEGLFHDAEIIVDGVAGTGLRGPLEGVPLEMVRSINRRREAAPGEVPRGGCVVVSIDVPSGIGEGIPPEAPAVNADYTLAIEPFKVPLYVPALRPRAGRILPVRGIFPRGLLDKYRDAELLRWADRGPALSPLPPDSHKYSRGVVEIRAGSPGSAGAARIAAAGASAAGAGLVRLVVDDELYPVLAAGAGGVMVVPLSGVPAGAPGVLSPGRFKPHALLLGPGWGRDEVRRSLCREARKAEEGGLPLVLDADGIGLLDRDAVFHGRAILTPHAGEMEALTGIPRGRLLAEPALIAGAARRFNAAILFKSHVMVLSSPEGRLGFIDGMDPALAAGGSGDLLAGFCAALAARMRAAEERRGGPVFDPYAAAAAAGTLLAAASRRAGRVFYDPLRLAETAARLAGKAWLPRPPAGPN